LTLTKGTVSQTRPRVDTIVPQYGLKEKCFRERSGTCCLAIYHWDC